MAKYCMKCGNEVTGNFCKKCGAPFESAGGNEQQQNNSGGQMVTSVNMIGIYLRKVLGGIFVFLGLVEFVGALLSLKEAGSSMMVMAVMGIGIMAFGFFLILKKPRTKADYLSLKQKKSNLAQKNQEYKEYQEAHMKAKHQAGLPLAQDAECIIGMEKDKFTFNGSGNNFNLPFEKITDICIKTDSEIQSQYVSSIGGAVAGAVVFGPLGAIVGGRAKQKTTTTISNYMIFTYRKENEVAFISFEIIFVPQANKMIKQFKELNKNNTGMNVEL